MVFNELKKYLNGKIYKITNTVNDEIYVGSTHHHLIKRWGQHISYAYDDDNIHKPLYKMIRDYGYERFKIELIKDFPCISRKQLEIEELTYIKQYGTLNIRGNDNIKTIYSRNKYDGSKLRLCSNINSIPNEKLNDINKLSSTKHAPQLNSISAFIKLKLSVNFTRFHARSQTTNR